MLEFDMTRKLTDNITIGSLETTGYEVTVKLAELHGKSPRLGFECKGKRVKILRSELLGREANEGN